MNVQQVCSYCGQAFKDVFLHIVAARQMTLEIRNIFLEYIVDYCIPQFSVYMLQILKMKIFFAYFLASGVHKQSL